MIRLVLLLLPPLLMPMPPPPPPPLVLLRLNPDDDGGIREASESASNILRTIFIAIPPARGPCGGGWMEASALLAACRKSESAVGRGVSCQRNLLGPTVFVSFGSRGFRIFGIQKVFVSFCATI